MVLSNFVFRANNDSNLVYNYLGDILIMTLNVQFGRSTQKAVIAAIRRHLPSHAEIIELSCGRGYLIDELAKLGHSVIGTNYSVYEDALPNVPILDGVDVTNPETLPDQQYDCVIFSESIQNIADHYAVYRSIRQLVRDGGIVVLTTPNTMNLKSRLHFLFTGFFKVKWNFISFDVPSDEAFCYHNHPVHLPVDLYYAHVCGLDLHSAGGIHVKLKSLLLYGLFVIPATLFTAYKVLYKEPFLKKSPKALKLYRILSSFPVLAAERLLLVFRQENPQEVERYSPPVSWYKRT